MEQRQSKKWRKQMQQKWLALLSALVLALLLATPSDAQRATALADNAIEEAGLSVGRLARIETALTKEVERGNLPGAVVMVARRGKIVYSGAFGFQDPIKKTPMRTDTIFRIY